jgi:hypothetical protein
MGTAGGRRAEGVLGEGEQRRHTMDAGELAARARTRGDAAPWLEQRWRWGRRPLSQPLARRNRESAAPWLALLPALCLLRVGEEPRERKNGG